MGVVLPRIAVQYTGPSCRRRWHFYPTAGPTHLKCAEDLEQVRVVPAGFEALGLDAEAFGLLVAQEVERKMTEDGKVRGGVAGPDAAVVLVEGHVQRPMKLVFDAPVAADGGAEVLGTQRPTRAVCEMIGLGVSYQYESLLPGFA